MFELKFVKIEKNVGGSGVWTRDCWVTCSDANH